MVLKFAIQGECWLKAYHSWFGKERSMFYSMNLTNFTVFATARALVTEF